MELGVSSQATPRVGAVVRYLFGVGGLAFALTILWLSMRLVMGIGGSCASGGPYVPAVECPDAVVALTPLSIFGIFIFGGLALWGGAQLGAGWAGLVALAWPALFLSLGWNFLEFGLRPPGAAPGELEWSWLICAVVFGLMGGGPLAVAIWGLREGRRGRTRTSGEHYTSHRVAASPRGGYELRAVSRLPSEPSPTADRLERLARLRDAGDLTLAEFEAAKRATLAEAGE